MATDSASASVLAKSIGAIHVLTLNRPEKLNAADLEMQQRLLSCLESVAADRDARAVVLTGAGRAFSAGGDRSLLDELATGHLAQKEELGRVHAETILCMLNLSIPAIAAVSGPAVGYAAGLVALCDIVVMGEEAFLCDPHVHFGLAATTAVQLVWPKLMSQALARELLLSGRKVGAEEARSIGLANRVTPSGKELAAALEIASAYEQMPPAGIAATKRAFNRPLLDEVAILLQGEV